MIRQALLDELREFRRKSGNTGVPDSHLKLQATRVAELVAKVRRSRSVILGDPTGTGKTAVALLAVKSLHDGGIVERVLIVAPNPTVADRWIEHASWMGLPARRGQRWAGTKILVSTYHEVRDVRAVSPAGTLVVVDEAHRETRNPENELARTLARFSGARLVLVTATPFQLSARGLVNMLTVVEDDLELEQKVLDHGTAVSRVLTSWRQVSAQGDLSEAVLDAAVRVARATKGPAAACLKERSLSPYPASADIPKPPRPTKLLVEVTDRWRRAFHVARVLPPLLGTQGGDAYLRGVLSSPGAFWASKTGRALTTRAGDSLELRRLEGELRQRLDPHPKVQQTVDWVEDRVTSGRHVLVFCYFKGTQHELEVRLRKRLGAEGVAAPDNAGEVEGSKWVERFKDTHAEPLVVVARDNLSESIDLDGGRPCLVHHDLSWNPVRLRQRFGRISRARTRFQRLAAADMLIPVLDLEADERLFATVKARTDHALAVLTTHEARTSEHDDGAWFLPDDILEKISVGW